MARGMAWVVWRGVGWFMFALVACVAWRCGVCGRRCGRVWACVGGASTLTLAVLQKLGNKLKFRQRVTATAIVFFKRFFLRCVALAVVV